MQEQNNNPKISVIMPAYNSEQFIAEAIDSILKQTFQDFEFIIINDGSTDNTVNIIKSFNDDRIVFINNSENNGIAIALNQGLKIAKGQYIARMDSDDIALPNRFEKQVSYMDKHPDVGVLGTQFEFFGEENRITANTEELNVLELFGSCNIGHPTVMIRKELFDKFNLRYNDEYKYCEDYELWSRMLKVTKIVNLPDVLLRYRWHKNNVSFKEKKIQLKNTYRVKQNLANEIAASTNCKNKLFFYFTGENFYTKFYLFKIIPLFKVVSSRNDKRVYIFNFLPLIKIHNNKFFLLFKIPLGNLSEFKK